MSATAFAVTSEGGNTDIPVTGTYQAGGGSADKIAVDIAWEAMNFTYTEPTKLGWNPSDHTYGQNTEGGWSATGGSDPKITVTNHSNVAVSGNFAFRSAVDGLRGSFTKDSIVLSSAEGTAVTDAPKGETAFSVSGSAIDADKALGTITVTVAKYAPIPQTISNAEELLATANRNGIFVLADDIDLGASRLEIASDYYVLDLNGHTISSNVTFEMIKSTGGSITIKNGTVKNTSTDDGGGIDVYSDTFLLENCNLVAFFAALTINHGTARVTDCKIQISSPDHFSFINTGKLTLSGSVNLSGGSFSNQWGTVNVLPGTYDFDVIAYVDLSIYELTGDSGAWTVTAR